MKAFITIKSIIKHDKMVVIRKRNKILREPKKARDISCVLLSINEAVDSEWLQELLEKRSNIYSRWSIRQASVGLPVFIAESGVGISACAKIGAVDSTSNPWKVELVDAEKIDIPISVEELRDLSIVKKNPPRTLQYLTKEQYKNIENLFE